MSINRRFQCGKESKRKRQVGRSSRRSRRRLLLQGLERRQLLAGDATFIDMASDQPAMVGHMTHSVESSVGPAVDHGAHAHPGDPARAGEHSAALRLVDHELATHTAVASGDWSDRAIWANAELPAEDARVVIPENVTVTVDRMVQNSMATIRVDGVLRFDPNTDTQLRVDTLVTTPSGRFEMGTAQTPIDSNYTASIIVADRGAIDRAADPNALGRGVIFHGSTEIHGTAKTSWLTADQPLVAGDQTISLSQIPAGWRVGDTLVVAGTNLDATGDEVVTIAAINGNEVTIDSPLTVDHVPPADDLQIHIANTTRNAFIQSENAAVDRRGHVMFMHNPDATVSYAGFYELGRTDKSVAPNASQLDEEGNLIEGTGTNVAGRYSVHFHRHGVAAATPSVSVVGSAVVGSPGWGYVNHSSNVDFVDNVSYDVYGAAFYTEAGDEIGSFVNNLSIKTHGSGESPQTRVLDVAQEDSIEGEDFGHSGDGFWFQGGTGLTVRDNVATGATGSGLIVFGVEFPTHSVPDIPFLAENLPDPFLAGEATTVPAGHTWLGEFSGNTAYGSAIGVQTYYHRSPIATDFEGQAEQLHEHQFDFPNSLIEDTTVWNANVGVMARYNVDVHFQDVRIVNAADQVGEIGMDVSNVYNLGEHIYEDLEISGFEVGLTPSPNGTVTIDGGTFANQTDIYLMYPRQDHRALDIRGDIQFASLDSGSELDESERQNLVTSSDTRILVDSSEEWFLYYDQITLNYGEFSGQQLYHPQQLAELIPFEDQPEQVTPDDPGGEVPEQYLGLTNDQMQQQFGASVGGVVATADAMDAPGDGIEGLIGSPAQPPATLISKLLLGSDLDIAILNGEVTEMEEDVDDDDEDVDEDVDVEDDLDDDEELDEEGDDNPEDEGDPSNEEEDTEPDGADDDDEENLDEEDLDDDEACDEVEDHDPDDAGDPSNEDMEDEVDDEMDDEEEDHDSNEENENAEADDGGDPDDTESDEEGASDDLVDLHNEIHPTDVNNDGETTALDALLVINQLSRHGADFLQALAMAIADYVDVNADGSMTALDALTVINALGRDSRHSNHEHAVDTAITQYDEFVDEDEDDALSQVLEVLTIH